MKIDSLYTRPRLLAKREIFTIGDAVGIYISSTPFFVHESGRWITTIEEIYSPDYKPCLAVESEVCELYYIYNYTDDTLIRQSHSSGQLVNSTLDVNKYYKLINWIVKNLPWRNRHR